MPLLAADGPGSGRGCPSPCRRRRAPSLPPKSKERGCSDGVSHIPDDFQHARKNLSCRSGRERFCSAGERRNGAGAIHSAGAGMRPAGCAGGIPVRPHDGRDGWYLMEAAPTFRNTISLGSMPWIAADTSAGPVFCPAILPAQGWNQNRRESPRRAKGKSASCCAEWRIPWHSISPYRGWRYSGRGAGSAEGICAWRRRLGAMCQSCATAPVSGMWLDFSGF